MSAFVLNNNQISKIVSWVTGLRAWQRHAYTLKPLGYANNGHESKNALGIDLLAMNQDAVMQRYPDCDATDLPGPINPKPYDYEPLTCGLFEAYDLIGSFIYQCSEGNVPECDLYKAVEGIYNSMAHRLARSVIEGEYK
jgi:hypothetical protein